ncbi:hypothetical protein J2Y03_004542 [Neobacillus niacini]|uniref:hypothetical protein n=1 Tax=Neobacillus niacini TaxID=86668 RepID=UPI0028601DBF|nr:hypothetical protein [Neobacillus niacini]
MSKSMTEIQEMGKINKARKTKATSYGKSRKRSDYFWGYLMIAPVMIGLTISL